MDGTTKNRENKNKKLTGVDAMFPLEIELQNGASVVSQLATSASLAAQERAATQRGNEPTPAETLYVASWDGTLRIWAIPKFDLDYVLVHTLQQHTDRITALHVSRMHYLTASDDGSLRVYGRYHGRHFDQALERVIRVGSRLKCMNIADHRSSGNGMGYAILGLGSGEVVVYPFGAAL